MSYKLEKIIDKKKYLIDTISMKDVLVRYGVRIYGNRCKCPIVDHGRKDTSVQVFNNGIKCYTCNKSYNIFDVVMKFECCDFSTAFNILGGNNDVSDEAKERIEEAKRKRNAELQKIKDYYNELYRTSKTIRLCEKKMEQGEKFSDEWCKWYHFWQYNCYKWEELFKEDRRQLEK